MGKDARTVAEYLSVLAREGRVGLLHSQATAFSVPGSGDKGGNPRDFFKKKLLYVSTL